MTSIFKLTYRLIQTTNLLSTSKISDQSAELLKTQTLLAEVFEHSSFPLTPFIQCPSNNCQINGINRCLYCSRPEKTKDINIAETAVIGMNEIGHLNSNSISEKNMECFARLPSNHMLSKANTQVKWYLQLCMQKMQGGASRKKHIPF